MDDIVNERLCELDAQEQSNIYLDHIVKWDQIDSMIERIENQDT